MQPTRAPEEAIALKSIVLRRTRPVLAIRDNDTKLEFVYRADSDIWLARLTNGDVRDHIVSDNDHGPPYRRYGALLR
jgi:hypothetical protein